MTRTIVVGIDGSPESKAALRWAIDEARLRRARLVAVFAWHYGVFLDGPQVVVPDLERSAEEVLDAAVDEAGVDGVEVERRTVQGTPAQALVEAAKEAELLVVGSRGRGGFSGLLLGSVSQQCVHHATCPVVVVRGNAAA